MEISVCMIVKNEEKILEECLQKVVLFADELIIVDTGSTDRTKEIAERYTEYVYDYVWEDDFSKARNTAFAYATKDYLMWVDADHLIDEKAVEGLIGLKRRLEGVNSVCLTYDSPDNGGVPVPFHMIMRKDGTRKWQGAVHERYPLKEPVMMSDIVIRHRDKREDHGALNLKSFVYRNYIKKITTDEIKEYFWLGMQCYFDLIIAREPEEAEKVLRTAIEGKPPPEEILRSCLLSGNNFMYWKRYKEALNVYEIFLKETALEAHAKMFHRQQLEQILLRAQKCSYLLGEIEKSVNYNEQLLKIYPDCFAAQCNLRWFQRMEAVTVSVCMIVRDEEAVLERCLKNAVQFADELIIVDTGSKDRTKKIAAEYTEQVYDYIWNDDFAAARNFSYGKAACDYVMWLDADDDLGSDDVERIRFLKNHMPKGTDVVYFTYTADAEAEDIFADNELVRDRLIRRELNPVWEYPIHEAILIRKNWKILYRPDIRIYHRKEKENEKRRNIGIFEKKMADGFQLNGFNRSYYCRELASDGNFEQAVEEFNRLLMAENRCDIDYAMFYYIYSMRRLKRYGELRKCLENYFKRFGAHEIVLCTLGDLCQRAQEYPEAVNWYLMALAMQIDIRDGNIHFPAYREFLPWLGIGKACIRMGKLTEAEYALNKAEQMHPSCMELKILKRYLERKVGQNERIVEETDGSR